MSQKVELLAPAGSPEAFYSAIHAGADAVYLAGNRFGARAYANNFTTEELIKCIRYAHIYGRRVYLTVNTLVNEYELSSLGEFLEPFYNAGLDGVIVQDFGVFCYIREHFPGMELHVSTQMTLTSGFGGNFLKEMGAVRIVPARELSLEELRQLKQETGLEIEAFIHGAMCYCYSGQCLFSSILGGRSGNRGRCAQPCRLSYRVEYQKQTTKECYPLSLKDMCTIDHIPELIEAGIDSFKIEGRMKRPEYAAGVTAIYRKYIDLYYAGKFSDVSNTDKEKLKSLYVRSNLSNGYLFRHNGRDMITIDNPSYGKTADTLSEELSRQFPQSEIKLPVQMTARFIEGEAACISVCLQQEPSVSATVTGPTVEIAGKQPITRDNICKQLNKLGETFYYADEIQVNVSDNAFFSLKQMNDLRRQAIEHLTIALIQKNGLIFQNGMAPLAKGQPAGEVAQPGTTSAQPAGKSKQQLENAFCVSVCSKEQVKAVCDFTKKYADYHPISRLYLDADLIYCYIQRNEIEGLNRTVADLQSSKCETYIALPPILRSGDNAYIQSIWDYYVENEGLFKGFLVKSADGLGLLSSLQYGTKSNHSIVMDADCYIWNHFGYEGINQTIRTNGFCIPYELNAAQQHELIKQLKTLSAAQGPAIEKVFYGYIPLMKTSNCIVNSTMQCQKNQQDKQANLIDRYHKKFHVCLNCIHCMNIIYNSLPLSLHKEFYKWRGKVLPRLNFTIENGQDTGKVLQFYLSLMNSCDKSKGSSEVFPLGEYTTGHEKRGVE